MSRFEGNPILEPVPMHPWESKYVFNPAMFELENKIHYILIRIFSEIYIKVLQR